MRYTYKEYMDLIDMPYEDKLIWSEQVILSAIKQSKKFCISLSWGKDSIVMWHMIHKFCKNGYVLFANTGVEYPETYKYRDMMLSSDMMKDINYVETIPKTDKWGVKHDFWYCVKKYGYPTMRTRGKGNKVRLPKCCYHLKESPMVAKEKELGIDLNFMGIQGTESSNRSYLIRRMGYYYFNKHNQHNVCLPLCIWKDEDVKRYAAENNIPLNPLYNMMKRTGCMYCTGFKSWQVVMKQYNERIYNHINKQFQEKLSQSQIDINTPKQPILKDCNI